MTERHRHPDRPGSGHRTASTARRTPRVAALLAAAVLAAGVAGALEFPSPYVVELFGEGTCSLALRVPGQTRDFLVTGTGSGQLSLYRTFSTEASFSTLQRVFLAGGVVALTAWEGLPVGEVGIVVATANPDELRFFKVAAQSPFLLDVGAVELEEDPGSCAFVGIPGTSMGELAVSLPGMDRVILLRESDGTWERSQVLPTGDAPVSLVGVDLDGDLLRELISADSGALSRSLAVYGRQESGDYAFLQAVTVAGSPRRLTAFDLDGDGLLEVAAACPDSARVVFLAGAPGLLAEVARADLTRVPDSLHLLRLPGGEPGLLTADRERGLVEFHRLLEGAWQLVDAYYPGCRPVDLTTCDFDGDGIGDLVSVGGASSTFSVMYGNPLPGFWGYPAISLLGSPGEALNGDFDGDGRADLLVAGVDRQELSLFRGQADGGLAVKPQAFALPFQPGSLAALEVDGDPLPELAVLEAWTGQVRILDRSAPESWIELATASAGTLPLHLRVADVDGDGHPDLVAITRDADEIQVTFGTGGPVFGDRAGWGIGTEADRVVPIDLNGDGRLDLVASDGISRVFWALNVDGRSFAAAGWVNADAGALHLAACDLDGDQDLDLIVGNPGAQSLTMLENDGNGALIRRVGSHVLPCSPAGVAGADIDGDGRADIVVNLREDGDIGVVLGAGSWQFYPVQTFRGGLEAGSVLVADFNQDQVPDLLSLDRQLLVGLALLNIDKSLVAVAPGALAADCRDGGLDVRVAPDRPGPWTLELGAAADWTVVARDGEALTGAISAVGEAWLLRLTAAELAALGGKDRLLLLTVGEPGATESRFLPVTCPGGAAPPPAVGIPDLDWVREPWPNPFNPTLHAAFVLEADGAVSAEIFDLGGRRVRRLLGGRLSAGVHEVRWDGRGPAGAAPAGVYLLSIRSSGAQLSRKVLLLK